MGISITNIVLTELKFYRNPVLPDDMDYSYHLELGTTYEEGDASAQVFLKITIQEKSKNLELTCCMLGDFRIENHASSPLPIDTFLHVNAPAMIYPYMREIISTTTQRAGLKKPLYIPVFNFKALYDRKQSSDKTTGSPE